MFTKTKNISFENPPFQYGATVLDRCKNKTKYQIDCNTPDGYMECYHLFPGIDLAYTTFKATSCFQRKKSLKNILEIAYCKAGRYECEYKRGFLTYLGEGDMSVSILEAQKEQPEFTTGFYDGVAIIVNQEITGNIFKSPISDLEIDFSKLLKRFCSGNGCCVLKTPPSLVHVFNEICDSEYRTHNGYLRLKTLEIFLLLSTIDTEDPIQVSSYYSNKTITKIKSIKEDIICNPRKNTSLKEYSKKYDLSLTMLKNCFKSVYGKPLHSFRKEYRIQLAATLLCTTSKSITTISEIVGYENPNKFSSAFSSAMNISPREYRQRNK